MIRQSPLRDRGSERTVSVQRDIDTSSTPTAEMIRQSPLRDTDSLRVVSVPRGVDTSRGTMGFRGSDGAVSLMQRNVVVACKGIKMNDHFKSSFILTSEAAKVFEKLKTAFTTASVLKHFNSELSTRAETDASGYVINDILSQLHEGISHSVAYYSRKQIPAEIRYNTHDKELLAIVESFKHWRHYCEDSWHKIEVLIDHHHSKTFMSTTRLHNR